MKTSMLYLTAAVLLCGCGQFMKGLSARAEQGAADAQYQLGKCYKHGDGVEVNRKESANGSAWLPRMGMAMLPIASTTCSGNLKQRSEIVVRAVSHVSELSFPPTVIDW